MLSRDALVALSQKGKFPNRNISDLLNSKQNSDAVVCKMLGVNKLSLRSRASNHKLPNIVTRADEDYPQKLKDFDDSPLVIYYRGDRALLDHSITVGIVGTRKATAYGLAQATSLSTELSSHGYVVISGLALGIDSAAHKAALDNGSKTIAVLGTPVDRIYPTQNETLAKRIAGSGSLVISEYPSGMKTEKYHFVFRNRIIAALSDILIIVEAPEYSGALATARYAMEYGKDVYVIPGDMNRPNFLGSNRLIGQGAFIIPSINDFLQCIGLDKKPTHDILESDRKILNALVSCEGNFDRMLECFNSDAAKLNVDLMRLEMEGLVKKDMIGKYYLV